MTTYICKCGRQVTKSTNADNTGNRDTAGCEGCPYLLPWGPTAWDDTRHAVVTDIKGYECRMSPELSYITELWGRLDDKCTMQINSLDLDYLERVSAWIKEHYPNGELSGGFDRTKMRACEFVAQGRYRMSIACAQNKAGMAAKNEFARAFFDRVSKTRLDIDPAAEKQLILDAIETGKRAAVNPPAKQEDAMEAITYKDAFGRLYRVGIREAGNADRERYTVEMLDTPKGSTWRKVKGAPEYNAHYQHNPRGCAQVYLDNLAKTKGWVAVTDPDAEVTGVPAAPEAAASLAAAEPQKCRYAGTFTKDGLECLCDPAQCATIAKVKPGDDVPCLTAGPAPDCRAYYAGRIINDEGMTVWKSMNHDSTAQLREYVAQMDAKQSEVATVEMDGNAAIYQKEPALAVKSAENPASAPADAVSPRTEPAAIAVPPAADIAAPAFDFGADEPTNTALLQCAQAFVAGRLAQVMAAKRAHDLTANNKNGAFGKWCEAVGISRDTGNNLVNIADNFGNIELNGRPLVEVTPISLLAIGSKPSAPQELKRGIESGDITTTKQYRELEAQLKAAREGQRSAETRAVVYEQKAAALEDAAKAAEDLKQKLYRRNEELQEKDQALNAALDQQGGYIAKIRELEKRPQDVAVQQPSAEDIERWRKEGEERARAAMTGTVPTLEEITKLANGYAAQIDGMRAVLTQLTQGMERPAVTRAADKLCLAADRLHDLIMYGPEAYGHG